MATKTPPTDTQAQILAAACARAADCRGNSRLVVWLASGVGFGVLAGALCD